MKKGYPWIDKMRIIAAILVVAIHTSPLLQMNETCDFVLTRIFSRLAVPFFMITTSYFLFIDGYPSFTKIKKTILELMKWYLIAICIYIPLMIYNHYFIQEELPFIFIKDLLIDGTFYHLWYFPAVMIGLIIILVLKKIFPSSIVLLLVSILYMIGLSGDSYYNIMSELPIYQDILNGLFYYMDYTRNGFFFAPMFLMIGALIHEQKTRFTLQGNIVMLVLTFIIMAIEAWTLHIYQIPRHDSMYITLPIVSYFLFQLLIHFQGQRNENLKNISLYIYIIHPMMIVVIRMIGKFAHVDVLVSHYLIQFIFVLISSVSVSMIVNQLLKGSENHVRENV